MSTTGSLGRPARLDDTMVVFDWNGTVMSDLHRAVAATNTVLVARGLRPLTAGQFQAGFVLPLPRWLVSLGIGVDDAPAAEQQWNRELAAVRASPRVEAAGVIAELVDGGALIGVLSAADGAAVEADIAAAGMADLFGFVATAVRDKAAHLRAVRGRRRRAIYVGDTEYDMRCARRAGFQAVAVTGGYRPADTFAVAEDVRVIDSLDELLSIVDLPVTCAGTSLPSG